MLSSKQGSMGSVVKRLGLCTWCRGCKIRLSLVLRFRGAPGPFVFWRGLPAIAGRPWEAVATSWQHVEGMPYDT